MTKDEDIFRGFVFEGRRYRKEEVEQAARTVQPQLTSSERKQVNDLLLQKLDEAKKSRKNKSNAELLDVPTISTLVNTLIIVNEPWITEVIANTIERQPGLRRSSVQQLHSTALVGTSTNEGIVGGVMKAILDYAYPKYGVSSFTRYLAQTIHNTLTPTTKQKKAHKRLYARMHQLEDFDQKQSRWTDRQLPPPDVAVNNELVDIIETIIPRLPSIQQRFTAKWMLQRLLATGELPLQREVAKQQVPPVSTERGRQIMELTINNIRKLIVENYPQLAEDGINGWEEFRQAFDNLHPKVRLDPPNGIRR